MIQLLKQLMMKSPFLLLLIILLGSCGNKPEQTTSTDRAITIKSDVLLEQSTKRPSKGTGTQSVEECTLTISGKTLLTATATLKVTDSNGEEMSCKSFPARALIRSEYKTANSALQEAHIREVVESYFETPEDLAFLN